MIRAFSISLLPTLLILLATEACLRLAHAQTQSIELAVTVDDLPEHGDSIQGTTQADITQRFLHAFKKHGLTGVFGFVNAGELEDEPELVEELRAWRNAGHYLGNHTSHHLNLNTVGARAFEADILANEPALAQLDDGLHGKWFRFPFLVEGRNLRMRDQIRTFLDHHGYRTAQVTVDFLDWAWNPAYLRCIQKNDQKGIARLKQTYLASAREEIRSASHRARVLFKRDIKHVLLLHIGIFDSLMIDELLSLYESEGVSFITLSEAMSDPVYQINPNTKIIGGASFLDQNFDARGILNPTQSNPDVLIKKLARICK